MAQRGVGRNTFIRSGDINRMTRTHHVVGAAGFQQNPRMLVPRGVGISMEPPPVLVPFIIEAGFGGPLAFRSMDMAYHLVYVLMEIQWVDVLGISNAGTAEALGSC
ncbi:hypothetical protein PIB30_066498 [Stylosanthes scabra]|uniref:Uncharacterized protein n=1 Tax=Stylosanthes scabra TaxID=79078 RepID=A0ABU6ULU2_9FABA|nr:hypothetical protein [Stylosanthes scabra]